ncbi:hypothetical protein OAA89_01955 [bacterium]|nr:hypothetical protein [bacterium]
MPDNEEITLSIDENAQAFLNEAVEKVLQASGDARHWQFAILHLVQSLELSLKSLLLRVHPILVYENIDNPKNMVSVTKAISRLVNPAIKGVTFSEGEKEKISKAIELRNKITHSEFKFSVIYAEKKYFELFAFILSFQSKYLDVEIENIVSDEDFERLLDLERSRIELLKKALDRIEDEGIHEELVMMCPKCAEDTFVAEESNDTCFLCRHNESTTECPQCHEICFEYDLEDFSNHIDSQYEEGQVVVHNSYGYLGFYACKECLPKIMDDIQSQNDHQEYIWEMEQEERHRGR